MRYINLCRKASSPRCQVPFGLSYLAAECLLVIVALSVGLIQRIVGVRSAQQSTPTKLIDVRRDQLAVKVLLKNEEPKAK